MAQIAVTSGNERKARITMMGAGNISSASPVKDLTIRNSNLESLRPDNKTIFLANGDSASNIGASGAYPSRQFNNTRPGEYISPFITSKIAGTTDTTMRTPAADFGQGQDPRFYGYTQLDITSWNAQTGAATYGAANGLQVLASGSTSSGAVGKPVDHAWGTDALPAEVVFMDGSRNPVMKDLAARNG